VNGKGAVTAAAFAAAIIQRGVDAGLSEFRRFSLLRTTSENTFESRLTRVIPLQEKKNPARAEAAAVAFGLRDSLPPDYKKGKTWIYAGLRGPIDRALTEYAASETATDAIAVVDGMVTALEKADRNKNHRARGIRFARLPGSWLPDLCADGLSAEARIGLAIASLKGSKTVGTILPYWLGVTQTYKGWLMAENCPFRRVWAPTTLRQNLAAVVHRRFVDMKEADACPPFSGFLSAPLADIALWIHGELDESELERWMKRFSLFTCDATALAFSRKLLREAQDSFNPSAELAVFALVKPLFEPELFETLMRGTPGSKPPRCARISRITALLSRNDLSAAVKLARETWNACGVRLIEVPIAYDSTNDTDNCQRLLGAMLIPVWSNDVLSIFRRWCAPIKNQENKQ
jgi:CRISPR-associated protein Csx17